jgi:hypothetical protein
VAERFYLFALSALGVWRITHMVSSEAGPWDCFTRARRAVEGRWPATLLSCFYCLSVWVAIPFAITTGSGLRELILLWMALSAAAILLERATAEPAAAAQYFEHSGEYGGDPHHVVLRKDQ